MHCILPLSEGFCAKRGHRSDFSPQIFLAYKLSSFESRPDPGFPLRPDPGFPLDLSLPSLVTLPSLPSAMVRSTIGSFLEKRGG
jgi:hypothetical protein